jgi:hypothetical protein
MQPATDIHNLEEIIGHLRQARLLAAVLSDRADDLDSLLSVTEGEARRVHMGLVNAESASVPVVRSGHSAERPKSSR